MLLRQTNRIYTMRGLTTQSAESIRFLLNGRDGEADRMVTVVDYFKGDLERISVGM